MNIPGDSESDLRPSLLHARRRVLEALADGSVLRGSGDALSARLGINSSVFRLALLDLVAGGWIYTLTTRDGILTIGRERRRSSDGHYNGVERRKPDQQQGISSWERDETTRDG